MGMVAAPASLSWARELLKEEQCDATCVSLAQKGDWGRYLALIKHSGSRVHDAIGDASLLTTSSRPSSHRIYVTGRR